MGTVNKIVPRDKNGVPIQTKESAARYGTFKPYKIGKDDWGNPRIEDDPDPIIDAVFQSRCGNRYPAITVREREVKINIPVNGYLPDGETPRGHECRRETRRVTDCIVQFSDEMGYVFWRDQTAVPAAELKDDFERRRKNVIWKTKPTPLSQWKAPMGDMRVKLELPE